MDQPIPAVILRFLCRLPPNISAAFLLLESYRTTAICHPRERIENIFEPAILEILSPKIAQVGPDDHQGVQVGTPKPVLESGVPQSVSRNGRLLGKEVDEHADILGPWSSPMGSDDDEEDNVLPGQEVK